MAELMIKVFLGHMVADYLLQPNAMALGKSSKGWKGTLWCTLHCLIYTATIGLFCWTLNPLFLGLIFLTHWPIDRWSFASKWLKLIRSRDFMADFSGNDEYRDIRIPFACLVYTAADNTMHFVLLFLIAKLFA